MLTGAFLCLPRVCLRQTASGTRSNCTQRSVLRQLFVSLHATVMYHFGVRHFVTQTFNYHFRP